MIRARAITICFLLTLLSAGAEIRKGLVSYWPLDIVTETYTPDIISGNNLTLNRLSGDNLVPGKHGKALSFNGTTQFLSLIHTNTPKLPISSSKAFTITFWVKGPAGQSNRIVFAEGNSKTNSPLFLLGTHREGKSGSMNAFIRWGEKNSELISNIPSEWTVFDDEWHHIAWVDNNGSARLYVDGSLDGISYNYTHQWLNLDYLSIGALARTPPVYFFKGEVDEIAIWERVLDEKEIHTIMEKGLTSELVQKLDE